LVTRFSKNKMTSQGIKIEITIRDEDWSKIDSFKCDSRSFHKIVSVIKQKYGLDSRRRTDTDWMKRSNW